MAVYKILNQEQRAELFLNTCYECGDKASLLCDAPIGGTRHWNFMPNKLGLRSGWYTRLCSVPLCEKCATKQNGRDYCKFHSSQANRNNLLDIPDAKTRAKITEFSLRGYMNTIEESFE